MVNVYPVIMCGGSGTRLWPASRPHTPKQFIRLLGDRSSFQQTVIRVAGIRGARKPIIIAGIGHVDVILEQLRELGAGATLLVEPEARDSAPAIAAAAAWTAVHDPKGLAVIVASDHHIPDDVAFQATVGRALVVAEQGWIVTLGVHPSEPSTAFGYIKPASRRLAGGIARAVEAFVEKPDRDTAIAYIAEGYLWNSGDFVVATATLMAELDLHAPAVGVAARAAVESAQAGDSGVFRLGPEFVSAPKVSIDYAVMERTKRAAVVSADFAWSDLGSWDAVKAVSSVDAAGNSVTGEATLVDASDCLVRTGGGVRVGLIGVSHLAVVVEPDAVLVTDLASSQRVKQLVEQMGGTAAQAFAQPSDSASLSELAARLEGWLTTSALPLWWALGADHEHGGFHENLDQTGLPTGAPRRGRVQARQIVVYASARAAGWPGPWRTAVDHGLRNFLDRYRRSDNLFLSLVDAHGGVLDESATLYDQAFALLAMASLFRLEHERADLLNTAGAVLDRARVSFAHAQGGFREAAALPFQSNPLMHLLEAALAWAEAGGGEVWENLARQIAELAMSRLIDPKSGAIGEYYAADWTPAVGPNGAIIWPGHQFEWAQLLARWGRRNGEPSALSAALRLFEMGSAGVDRARSVAVDAMDNALWVTDARARLWPQAERLKAAVSLAAHLPPEGRASMLAEAADAARGLWRYLETPTPGLWRDRALPDGGFVDGPAPASSLYHLVGAIYELAPASLLTRSTPVDGSLSVCQRAQSV